MNTEEKDQWKKLSEYGEKLKNRLIYRCSERRGLSREDIDDVIQDSFVKILKYKDLTKFPRDLERIFSTIVRNKMIDLYRRNKRWRYDVHISWDSVGEIHTKDAQPPTDSDRQLTMIKDYVDGCQPPTRALIARKFYLDGRTPGSIATDYNINVNTVYSHLSRIRHEIRSVWDSITQADEEYG